MPPPCQTANVLLDGAGNAKVADFACCWKVADFGTAKEGLKKDQEVVFGWSMDRCRERERERLVLVFVVGLL